MGMRKPGKKWSAVLLAASMIMGTGAAANAAADGDRYAVAVKDRELVITNNGADTTPYALRSSEVKLIIDEAGDLLVCFTNEAGQYKGISLGDQRALKFSGEMDSLTLDSSLIGKTDVTLSDGCSVGTLTVNCKGDVTIEGDVTTLLVNGSARVGVAGSASVGTARVNSKTAKLTAGEKASVDRVVAANGGNISGFGIGDKTTMTTEDTDGKYRVRLKVEDSILYYAKDSDGVVELRDIDDDQIAMNVQATGTDEDGDKHYLSGEYRWAQPHDVIFDPDSPGSATYRCRFTFTPNNEDYAIQSGTIKVEVVYR